MCLQPKPLRQPNGQVCQICGDDVGLAPGGEPFVACNECAFPVCRDCYEYERREGTQNCPQCKTRYKRLKGTTGLVHAFLSFLLFFFFFLPRSPRSSIVVFPAR